MTTDIIKQMQNSIDTGIELKLFTTRTEGAYTCLFCSSEEMFPMSKIPSMGNFNPARLCDDPYPVSDRPRGKKDLQSVKYHRQTIKNGLPVHPIWIYKHDGAYTLLDGAHRIVAHYLENKRKIPAIVVQKI